MLLRNLGRCINTTSVSQNFQYLHLWPQPHHGDLVRVDQVIISTRLRLVYEEAIVLRIHVKQDINSLLHHIYYTLLVLTSIKFYSGIPASSAFTFTGCCERINEDLEAPKDDLGIFHYINTNITTATVQVPLIYPLLCMNTVADRE
jgi:hypothetical protein